MGKLTQEDAQRIKEYYKQGLSSNAISKIIGCQHNTIDRFLRKNGLQTRGPAGLRTQKTDYFHSIDAPSKAYVLGFIYADGCMLENGVLSFGQKKEDTCILDFICQELHSAVPIRIQGEYARLNILSLQITEDLKKHGIVPRKSMTIEWPTTVPDHLIWHFLRGYFDGDGGVGIYKSRTRFICCATIACSHPFAITLGNFLASYQISSSLRPSTTGSISEIRINGFRNCSYFAQLLYKDASFSLPRKRIIFSEIAKHR
jgi:hypothetical protein